MKLILGISWFACSMFFAASGVYGESHTLDFLVFKGNDQIGTLTISRVTKDNRITYSLTSTVKIELLIDFNIIENITDVFEQGYLMSSTHTRHVNGSLRANNTVEKRDDRYKLTNTDALVRYLRDPIKQSVLSLYFHEPGSEQEVYSQNFQKLVLPRKTEDHTYTVELPNGNTTTYQYQLGRLSSVASQTRFGTITFIPRP